jgi:hypothetical protein
MPIVYQAQSLQMEWCLNCHRAPEKQIRPKEEVFNMAYVPPTPDHPYKLKTGETVTSQEELGLLLKKQYGITGPEHMTTCSVCHR